MKDYAQGYTAKDAPIRLHAGVLASEAYGLKSCSEDLIRYVEVNMDEVKVDADLRRAVMDTHITYFEAGELTQDLIWEQYAYPVELKRLLAGNEAVNKALAVVKVDSPKGPSGDVWMNKTGSTNGFSMYAAFVPGKKMGVVMLANKSFPTERRVIAGYGILMGVEKAGVLGE